MLFFKEAKKTILFYIVFIIIFSWLFSGWPQILNFSSEIQDAQAMLTTDIHPSAYTSTTGFNGNFSSLTNAYSSNDQYATASIPKRNQEYATNFRGFNFSSIPAGSVINSVTVYIEKKSSASNTSGEWRTSMWADVTVSAALTSGATGAIGNLQYTSPSTNTTDAYWSQSWGTLPTLAQLQGANFGIRVQIAQGNNSTVYTYSVDDIYIVVDYTTTPTITTQAAGSVEAITATCNGNITATGGENSTARGCEWDTDSGAPYANSASDSGSFGAGAFTKSLTGLPSGTIIYARAFATNSIGTGYGSEISFLTKPATPTSVSATDGTYTDRVTITWTKSTGATDYHVWRDSTDLGAAGDVATFDDTGADAPTITAGSAVAGDGTNTNYVALSLSGTSVSNGTTHTYKVVASNATGNSADSSTDTGYRSVGSLTYQWQRSAADSDASYSDISGATSATYNDTGAPSDGSGRYYICILNAIGAIEQTSAVDRGYRSTAVVSISLDVGNFDYGKVPNDTASSTLSLWAGAGITATNGDIIANFDIYSADSTGSGGGWTLAADSAGNNYIHKFCNDTDNDCVSPPSNYTVLTTSPQTLKTSVAVSGTVVFQLQITTPTTPTDVSQQSSVVTIQASEP